MMNQPHTLRRSPWLRLVLGLCLLIGLGMVTGGLTRSAHAATTITVSTCDESHLDAAVAQANSENANDTIAFNCSGDIPLTSTLTITGSMTLDGSGQSVTLDGGNSVQVLSVNSGVTFILKALTVAHGSTSGNGGGLYNNGGMVSITNSTFVGNSAGSFLAGGGLYNNAGTVTISNSTFANNSATVPNDVADGGGLVTDHGTVTISNSTFANNSASGIGGGLYILLATVTISNSTFANNSASTAGGGLVDNSGTLNIGGSIVAKNVGHSVPNCYNNVALQDQGYNLESGTDCGFTGTGSLQNTDPKLDLSGLQSNGGPTQTIALQSNSPAIDHIPAASCPATDQRGNARPDDAESTCDMGAYESNYPPDADLGLSGLPSDIAVNATSAQGATVTYTPPTATDESGDSSTASVSCTPASGSTFPIGTTTVTCTATDSDDSNSPVSQSFTVTVNDTDLGLSNVPTNITTRATSAQGAVVTYTSPTAVDEDSPLPTVTCDHASGSTFPVGATTVTCTVSDSDDTPSSVSASFTVTVTDTDLGLSNMPGNITTDATSPQGAKVTYTPPTAVDEDSPAPSVSCTPASGSTFAIGTTTVTCTVSDSDDTPSSVRASFTVTVKGAAAQVSDLITLVNSFGLPPDFQASFDTQLQAVQTDLTNHNSTQACRDLGAFISHVKAQSGKGLMTAQANQLSASARQIQAVLGC